MTRRHAAALLLSTMLAACSQLPSQQTATLAPPVTITVDPTPGPALNPAMWGVFFEDINFGADGGLYAELIKNRAFEFPESLMGWSLIRPSNSRGGVEILADNPAADLKDASPHFARLTSTAQSPIALANEGFRGIGLKAKEEYRFSTRIRRLSGNPKITVELVSHDGTVLASAPLAGASGDWSKLSASLKPSETSAKGSLNLVVEGPGVVDFDFVSLFPADAHRGVLRKDMVDALKEMKPGFLRFPGGCIVEGSDLSKRYQWKNTIGPVESRKLLINRWNYEFKHRPTPDYFQTFGLGFFEYFQLCEDLGAKPLPIINCGMACQFNSGELCKLEDLQPFIQDALDLIEFANGPASSAWGAKRAAMGHPEPFGMTMMGVGNEQWGPQYIERLKVFTKAIKEKYPDIQLVSDAGPSPADERFEFLWPHLKELKADIVDEHTYANPIWFLANAHRYDSYDRKGPKIFFGEYAAQSDFICSPRNQNTLECALAEAAYMTGLERNGDVVRMASYAPLFANVDAWQWVPDMIYTNSLTTLPSANYYVQQAFMHHRGDAILKTTNTASESTLPVAGRITLGTARASAEFKDITVVSGGNVGPGNSFNQNIPGQATLFQGNLAPADKWTRRGDWKFSGGILSQPDPTANASATIGEPTWSNYTLSLKARKTAGSEGFFISVCDDGKGSSVEWVLGGWNNTKHALQSQFAQQAHLLAITEGAIEPNRWYDIKVVAENGQVAGYLDGKLVQSAALPQRKVPALFTSATRDNATGDTILKIVNPGPNATPVRTNLHAATATLVQITGKSDAVNTFDAPKIVAPKTSTVPLNGLTVPPHSFSILRIPSSR